VPKAEDPSQQGGAKQSRVAVEGGQGPAPGGEIESDQRTE